MPGRVDARACPSQMGLLSPSHWQLRSSRRSYPIRRRPHDIPRVEPIQTLLVRPAPYGMTGMMSDVRASRRQRPSETTSSPLLPETLCSLALAPLCSLALAPLYKGVRGYRAAIARRRRRSRCRNRTRRRPASAAPPGPGPRRGFDSRGRPRCICESSFSFKERWRLTLLVQNKTPYAG